MVGTEIYRGVFLSIF